MKVGPAAKLDPERWVEEYGDCLYRYALGRVRTPEVAEDLVQDTLLAAVRTQQRFAGRSSERSWLVGILKHKIVDHYRRLGRESETSFTDLEFLRDGGAGAGQCVEGGGWNHDRGPRAAWRQPAEAESVTHRAEFWQTLRGCLDRLPPRVAAVFTLREMEGMSSKEICAALQISEANLWVMLHRARRALREGLEVHWFARASSHPAAKSFR